MAYDIIYLLCILYSMIFHAFLVLKYAVAGCMLMRKANSYNAHLHEPQCPVVTIKWIWLNMVSVVLLERVILLLYKRRFFFFFSSSSFPLVQWNKYFSVKDEMYHLPRWMEHFIFHLLRHLSLHLPPTLIENIKQYFALYI